MTVIAEAGKDEEVAADDSESMEWQQQQGKQT